MIPTLIDMLEVVLGASLGGVISVALAESLWRREALRPIVQTLRAAADAIDRSESLSRPSRETHANTRPKQFEPPTWAKQPDAPPVTTALVPANRNGINHATAAAPALLVSAGGRRREVSLKGGLGAWLLGSGGHAQIDVAAPAPDELLLFQQSGTDLLVADLTMSPTLVVDGRKAGASPVQLQVGSTAQASGVVVKRIK